MRGLSYHAIMQDNETYYYFCNAHGDTTGVVDSNGSREAMYDYDEFGNLTFEYERFDNDLLYAGEFIDNESENYYLRSRYYDPTVGWFTQQDTFLGVDSNPLSLNRYTYCHNNPIMYIDPSGHYTEFRKTIEGFGSIIYDADQLTSSAADEEFGRYLYQFKQGEIGVTEFFRQTSAMGVNVGIQNMYYDISETSILDIQFGTAVSYNTAMRAVSTIAAGGDKDKVLSQLNRLSMEAIKYTVTSADPVENTPYVRADYLAAINGLSYTQGSNEYGVYFTIGFGTNAKSYYTGPHKADSDIVYSKTVNGQTKMYMNKDEFYKTFRLKDTFTWMSNSELGNAAYFVWDSTDGGSTFRHQMGNPNEIPNGRFKIISGTRFVDSETNADDIFYLGDNGKEMLVFADVSSIPQNIMYARPEELSDYLEENAYGQDTVAGRAIAALAVSGTLPDNFDEGHYAYDYLMYRAAVLSEWNVMAYRANPNIEDTKNAFLIAVGSIYGQKYSLKKINGNKRANEVAQKLGYKGAEDLKKAYVGKDNISKYNMKYDSNTGEIILESIKDSRVQIETGEFMPK